MSHTNDDDGHSDSKAYETRDVKIRPLVVFIVGLTVATIAAYLVVLGVFRVFNARETSKDATADPVAVERAALTDEQRLPAQPRIQADPSGEYQLLRQQEEHILTTYGWVDRPAGVVRIPVDQAMKLVVEQGLPVRQSATASPATGTPALLAPQGTKTAQPPTAARKK
jgi:hypothetical protein